MKIIPIAVMIGLAAVSSVWAEDKEEAVKKDLALLQGEWSMVSASADGQPMPEGARKEMKRVCKGDETTTMMGAQVFLKAKFTIDPLKKPKTIDYQMTGGFTKGQRQLGIYEVDGDTFKACFGKPGAERPTDFSTKPGDGRTLSVWKRERQLTTANAADLAGVYALVSVNGKPVPASLSHDGAVLQVRSGTFTINADGTCRSKMIFVPPSGTEATREVSANYTQDGSKLTMQWKGAGTTVGTIDGNTFTMENEGMVLVYRK